MSWRTRISQGTVIATVLVTAAGVVAAGCGGAGSGAERGAPATVPRTVPDEAREGSGVTTPPGDQGSSGGNGHAGGSDIALPQRCTNPDAGYAVSYPEGWHANDGEVTTQCSFFHDEPFELPEATEPSGIAIAISLEPVPFQRITADDPTIRVLDSAQHDVDGHRALRRESEATGDGLFPAGMRSMSYFVDRDGETLRATTREEDGLDYDRNVEVLDAMIRSLELRHDQR